MTLKIFSRLFHKKENDTKKVENKEVTEFRETLSKAQNVEDIYVDDFGAFLSSAYDKGLIEEIPMFGWVIKLGRKSQETYNAFKAYTFCKKTYSFIVTTKSIPRQALDDFFKEYSDYSGDDGYELLLSVIDKIDNTNKVKVIANLMKAKIAELISMEDFIRLISALQITPYVDLDKLSSYINGRKEGKDSYSLQAAGLISQITYDAEGPGKFQLNDNGLLMVKYGLNIEVKSFNREFTKIEGMLKAMPAEDIDKMFE